MKIILHKRFRIIALHLFFWLISLNIWYIVFNPGVESVSIVKGLNDLWPYILLANSIYFFYCLLPFTWFLRKTPRWIKITASLLFLVPLLFLIYRLIIPGTHKNENTFFDDFFISGFLYVVIFHLPLIAAVYFNLKELIPRYLTLSKFGVYILTFVALTLVTAFLDYALFTLVIDHIAPSLFFISYFRIWELMIIVAAYLLFTTLLFLVWQYAAMLIANRDKAQNELSALKAQINPHFLFNNLNTIYSLASKNEAHTKDVILKLSDFLRYILYDTNQETILLGKEVETIRTYVELQKERIDPAFTPVTLHIEGEFGNTRITPLLLLPLAENCFKHGIGKDPGEIGIYIGFDGKQLRFKTENRVALREKNGNEDNGGIGIKNVEKRLNLLYPGRYSLNFEEKKGVFISEMTVDLE